MTGPADRRTLAANGRVAHADLAGRVAAERFVTPEWLRVTATLADLRAAPGGPRDRQLLYGARFGVLEQRDGWAFGLAADDGYVGHVAVAALAAGAAATHWVAAPATHVYPAPDLRREPLLALSFGARLTVVAEDGRHARTDGGGFVPLVHLRRVGDSSRRGPHRVLAAAIRDAGVNIAFGTDNMTEDMFQAMHVGSVVHRGSYGGGVRPGPQAILDAVTRNGAASIGRLADLGSVEPGKKADLTILDLDTPAMRPVISLVSNIVHYGHPGVVHSVMVDGTFLLEDRRVLCMDEAGALDEAEAAARSAWRRLHRDSPDIEPPQGCRWL